MANLKSQYNLDNFRYRTSSNPSGFDHLIINGELAFVQKELITSKMHLMNKDKLLMEIRGCLSTISNAISDQQLQQTLNKLIYRIESSNRNKEWREFERHFDLLHSDFFKKLKKTFPCLSLAEIKLCGLIKLKLSTKEMASYLNLSLRGIETKRYRLRKKIYIENGITLEDFLDKF